MHLLKNRFSQGFTLIEVLLALSIFALVAAITSSSLYHAFDTKARVTLQADRLNELQIALSLIQQDILQTTERAIRTNDMLLVPAFVGQTQYFELTKDGYLNPNSVEKRSTLKRVAYLCKGTRLIYRSWSVLDPVNKKFYEDKVILNQIKNCHFNYLNRALQVLPEWRPQETGQGQVQNQNKELLPKAVQINFNVEGWGEMNLWFIIPGGLYTNA